MQNTAPTSAPVVSLDAQSKLWVLLSLIGLATTVGFCALTAVIQTAWAWRAAHDAALLGFMLPAFGAAIAWVMQIRRGQPATASLRELHQIAAALWVSAALGIGFAQGFVGKAWLVGELPVSVALAFGTCALSPILIWRLRPDLLRRK